MTQDLDQRPKGGARQDRDRQSARHEAGTPATLDLSAATGVGEACTTASVLRKLHAYLNDAEKGAASVLRDPQVGVVQDLHEFYRQDKTWGFIKLPTGSGKTVIFAEIAEALNLPTLVVVPKIGIGDQTVNTFRKFAPDMKVSPIFAGQHDDSGQVVVTTYQYLAQAAQDGRLDLSRFQFVILDEAHKSLGTEMLKVLESIEDSTRVLGFTATDTYNEEKNLEALLGECISDMPISSAVKLGMLTPISVIVAKTTIDVSDVEIKASGEYDERALEKRILAAGINKACLDTYKAGFDGKSAIAFCTSVAHAEEAAEIFNESGVPSAAVSGSLSRKEQARILEEYRSGKIKVLFNADLLIEGFDAEIASVCLNMAPTGSLIVAEQRAGRAFRLNPGDSSKVGYVVEFVYDDARRQSPVILYSDIIGGTACPPPGQLASAAKAEMDSTIEKLSRSQIEGLTIHVDASSVLEIAAKLKPATFVASPPDGWISTSELGRSLRASLSTVMKMISTLTPEEEKRVPLDQHCGHYRAPSTGRLSLHCSPELAELIAAKRREFEPPQGWMTITAIAELFSVPPSKVQPVLREVAAGSPDMIRQYAIRRGGLREHYSPECIEAAREHLRVNPEKLPMFSSASVASKCKVPDFVMRSWVRELVESGELYEVIKLSKTGKPTLRITQQPGAEKKMRDKAIAFHGRDLEQERSLDEIAKDMNVGVSKVADALARRFGRAPQPSDTSVPLDLEEPLKRIVASESTGPLPEWVMSNDLAREAQDMLSSFPIATGIARNIIQKRLDALISRLPEYHRLPFRDPASGATRDYYSPQFSKLFLDPEHWRDLAEEYQ